ncbi:MAG: glycogen synthase GlgA [Pseudomonadota bacterium]|nr:glycogen synthase GlgA [Pseudomonadota bacterium]
MKVLFATSELYPLIKTGGLADVSQGLSAALARAGAQVTLILPGYGTVLSKLGQPEQRYPLQDDYLRTDVGLARYRCPQSGLPLLLVECPALYERDGGPYASATAEPWPDNAERFAQFCRAVVCVLAGRAEGLASGYEVVHCNDWQTGLIPGLVRQAGLPQTTLFTIHNLAYQGIFDHATFQQLQLPPEWWHFEALEFFGRFSFMKAGIVFSHRVTTVSPTYAEEILHEPLGCGMAGLLQHHAPKLSGILNGADYSVWNPADDPCIRFHYDADRLPEKLNNKLDLQRQLGLRLTKTTPLIGMVGRLEQQKGVDWLLAAMEALQGEAVQWVILGSGRPEFEQQLQQLARRNPKTMAVIIGYDETLAHRIEAGSDLFAMPSRFEPCGLNQIYSLRYGTLPVVRHTGGLADTVNDASDSALAAGTATGFVFSEPTAEALTRTLRRAISRYAEPGLWRQMQLTAMAQRFDWERSAHDYLTTYQQE